MLWVEVMSNPTTSESTADEELFDDPNFEQPNQPNGSGMGQPGPHKDIDTITEILTSDQVRWFYKEQLGNAKWTPFGGFDTLVAEDAYRKLPPDLKVPKKIVPAVENVSEPKTEAEYASTSLKVQVLGGLYELDLLRRKISSVYWPGEVLDCTRGTWFYGSWQPLDELTADLIEQEHLKVFQGKKTSDFAAVSQPIHSQTFTDFNVDWYSPTEVYFFSNRAPSQLVKTFTRKIGYFQKSAGTRVVRAFKILATEGDRRKEISHLVFVVHGVGQIMNMNIGDRVFGNTCAIRERVTFMKEEYFPDSEQYVEFFPVEWRSKVALDEGLVDRITPPNIKYLRQFINTSAMDLMYYMSPVYCGEIQECVANEMNRLYAMFRERNPHINPKVSLVAHSLGVVIGYDIVTGYLPQGFSKFELVEPGKSRLIFPLDNFFCFGSPLSVFLAMREKKGTHSMNLFPPSMCNRLYNIYHITDPIAYRLEPLLFEAYCRIAPVPIQPHNCLKPKRYSEMPLVPESPDDMNNPGTDELPGSLDSPKHTVKLPALPFKGVSGMSSTEEPNPGPSNELATSFDKAWKDRGKDIWNNFWAGQKSAPGSVNPAVPLLDHRLDYVLTSGATGALVIKSVLVSHMAYWSDNDVAFFILTRICPELEDELCSGERPEKRKYRKRKKTNSLGLRKERLKESEN